MNYQIEFKNYDEFKRAVKMLQELTHLPLSIETTKQLYSGLFPSKRYCIASYGGIGQILTTIDKSCDAKIIRLYKNIKYNKYLTKA